MPPKDINTPDGDKPIQDEKTPLAPKQKAGPKLGAKGEYLPAVYETKKGNTREDR